MRKIAFIAKSLRSTKAVYDGIYKSLRSRLIHGAVFAHLRGTGDRPAH